MPNLEVQQAVFSRRDFQQAEIVGRSPAFADDWVAHAYDIIQHFGDRVAGMRCPEAIFARPIGAKHVAIVGVKDNANEPGLWFHFLVISRSDYDGWVRDPFLFAEKVPPTWSDAASLPVLQVPKASFVARTLAELQAVLKRVKASALKEGEDPEAPDFERTVENSESPALLGGAQILVDGGRLVFERPQGDLRLVSGLWLLLPEATRMRLWPTSFAFGPDLDFDVLVVPRADEAILEGYTTEDQAAGYPEGTYEVALQRAVEQGTQHDLDAVFNRRDSHHVIRLALLLLAFMSVLVLLSRVLDFGAPPQLSVPQQQAVAGAGIVAAGEPWTALGMYLHGKTIWKSKEKQGEQK